MLFRVVIMVSGFISRIVILVFGTLYPAYASYKAVRTKNVKEYVKWMMYWIVFALFTCAETFTDLFLSFWFPFYYEIKIITVIYLLSPATKGSSILYRKFVHPVLIKREQEIDEYIAKAKEQGYHTMLNLGSKGVNYATSLIMQTAIKGGGGLVNQLKKSYSLNDLSEEQNLRKTNGESADNADSPYGQDPRLIRRSLGQGTHSPTSSTGQTGLFFPETDISQRPGDGEFRQIPSYEEISSGYSSGEPYYYAMNQSKGCNLARTASLGPSSRVRTRASTKQGLPKRSSLAEGGWSAMEPYESQNESDNRFNFPLAHSASFPFAFPPPQCFLLPEYQQHMFGNLTQNQIFTFINQSQYSQLLDNKTFQLDNNSGGVNEGINIENLPSPSVVISEESSDNVISPSEEENEFLETDAVENAQKVENNVVEDQKNIGEGELKNVHSENVAYPNENLDGKSLQERSGRYNKKPAPTPPIEEAHSKTSSLTIEEDETGFFTPNSSPKPERKLLSLEEKPNSDVEIEEKPRDDNLLQVPGKSKSKAKKTESNKKKLHMPKMSFSFWHQKGSKQASASETSSVASVEISTNPESRNDLEYFIPLRDDGNETEGNDTSEEHKHN